MVLHPDKTKFMLFTRSNVGADLNLFCNNNNLEQDLAVNVTPLGQVTADDNTPAVKEVWWSSKEVWSSG